MNTNKRRLKHGSLAVAITVLVLAAVMVFNILFTWIAEKNLLYIDGTAEQYNEISSESRNALSELDSDENNFKIYFLADRDELRSASLGYSKERDSSTTNLWGMKFVHELALQFEAAYDFVQVDYLSLKDDVKYLDNFKTTIGTTFSKQDVIIDNPTYEKDAEGNTVYDSEGNKIEHHNFRVCNRDAFFTFDSSTYYVFAFKGDLQFTSTILSLSGANPTVYFVTGHGEKVGSEADVSDFGDAQAMRDLFYDAGFVTKKVNLTTDYQKLFDDKSARIIVVYGPETDYAGEGASVNEITILNKFFYLENHHIMFFTDKTSSELPNLSEYIEDYYGVTVEGTKVKDAGTNELSSDGMAFIAQYESNEYSVGINLTKSLLSLDSQPKIAFRNAATLKMSDRFTQSAGFYEDSASRFCGAVFLAPKTALSIDGSGNTVKDYSSDNADPVMVLTYDHWLNEENDVVDSYALICGSTDFTASDYLNDAAYGNHDIMYLSMRLMGKEDVPFEIDFKVVQSEGLTIPESELLPLEICLCSLVPVTALVLCAVVFFKRKHM